MCFKGHHTPSTGPTTRVSGTHLAAKSYWQRTLTTTAQLLMRCAKPAPGFPCTTLTVCPQAQPNKTTGTKHTAPWPLRRVSQGCNVCFKSTPLGNVAVGCCGIQLLPNRPPPTEESKKQVRLGQTRVPPVASQATGEQNMHLLQAFTTATKTCWSTSRLASLKSFPTLLNVGAGCAKMPSRHWHLQYFKKTVNSTRI